MLSSEICQLTFLRINEIVNEYDNKTSWQTSFVNKEEEMLADFLTRFFANRAKYLIFVKKICDTLEKGINSVDLETLRKFNRDGFLECLPENYANSFANPEYVYNCLMGILDEKRCEKLTGVLSFIYAEIQALYNRAFVGDEFAINVVSQLFLECFGIAFEDEDIDNKIKFLKEAVYYYISDYADEWAEIKVRQSLESSEDYFTKIIMESDLSKEDYLYKYGEYISEQEIKISRYLQSLNEDTLELMADNFVEAYVSGFKNNNLDLSVKETVNLRYNIGFEPLMRKVVNKLLGRNLEPIIYQAPVLALEKKVSPVGVHGLYANPQYEYDHKFDKAVFLDKELLDKLFVHYEKYYRHYEDKARVYAGPMLLEVFGEEEFECENHNGCNKLSDKQNKLFNEFTTRFNIMLNDYVHLDTTSFSIVAYPIPAIGDSFEEIFAQTVKINTLNTAEFEKIQLSLIDCMDKGEYIHIIGENGNKTDLKVALTKILNPDKETRFENCLADVNIPLGEVFTSPKLQGTNGVLHVKKVYLNGLMYKDFSVTFKDGMIEEYSCDNFKELEKGKHYIKENVLHGFDTLPIGEFAIGTNTMAYSMGKKYDIFGKLPILIAEKCGPHFAVGDTCYKMSEDVKTFNSNGKEIVAKDNEISLLRKTDVSKAYFGCHTDITIPYEELECIKVVMKDNSSIDIIKNGKFVLEGSEKLNEYLY
ncbi:MAG: aminopeptidase [Lachnospiraceae bacterium]|nr:aminopeptidase [Lachnospiraceae bacterium]